MTAKIFHAHLYGTRESKYERLADSDVDNTPWSELQPSSPFYLFVPQDTKLYGEYEKAWKITDVFPVNCVGIVTARDALTIHWNKQDAWKTVSDFVSLLPEDARRKYKLPKDAQDWKVEWAQRDLQALGLSKDHLACILYRPFDVRYTYYTAKPSGFHCRPRGEVMRHMLARENLSLIVGRSGAVTGDEEWNIIGLSCHIIDFNFYRRGGGQLHPLYLYPAADELDSASGRRPNLSPAFLEALAEKLKLTQEEPFRLPKGITPEDIFHYAYAVFHSPTYRTRYAEFLKIDFPRLPLTGDLKLFRELAAKGAELAALHLMESPKLAELVTEFPQKGGNVVDKVRYTDADRRVWINRTQYFQGVSKECWEFHVGGYQVCHKWLKDRKGRELGYEEIEHYQKIVVALRETIRLMREIDESIPGWPLG